MIEIPYIKGALFGDYITIDGSRHAFFCDGSGALNYCLKYLEEERATHYAVTATRKNKMGETHVAFQAFKDGISIELENTKELAIETVEADNLPHAPTAH